MDNTKGGYYIVLVYILPFLPTCLILWSFLEHIGYNSYLELHEGVSIVVMIRTPTTGCEFAHMYFRKGVKPPVEFLYPLKHFTIVKPTIILV
jgi:hypothetical protein